MKNTEHTTLKQASQHFYAEQQLPDASLERFEQLLSVEKSDLEDRLPELKSSSSKRFNPSALVASVGVAAVIGSIWLAPNLSFNREEQPLLSSSPMTSAPQRQQQMVASIAFEVTKNHIKLKPLEVTSQDFNTVRNYFTQLDFSPQLSLHFPQLTSTVLTMAGGRYCSIQSETAAQLRYRSSPEPSAAGPSNTEPSPTEKWSTLYQTQYSKNTFGQLPHIEQGQAPIETYSRGLKVNIWVERQLLMVSVEDAASL